jgi:hypothetical protein
MDESTKEYQREYQKKYRNKYKKSHKRVSITLTSNEYKAFESKAKIEGVKVTELIKNMALYNLQQKTFVPASILDELKSLSFLIRNIANNVNQTAHYSNMIKGLVDEHGLLEHLRKLDETVKSYTLDKIKKQHDN